MPEPASTKKKKKGFFQKLAQLVKDLVEWVEETSMLDVLRRHVPALKPALAGVENAFKPWRKVGQ